MQESRIPATVKVPPMMAQICERGRKGSASEISAEEASDCPAPAPQEGELTHEEMVPLMPILFAILSPAVFRAQGEHYHLCQLL